MPTGNILGTPVQREQIEVSKNNNLPFDAEVA